MNLIYMETISSSGNVIHLHIVHSDTRVHQMPEISAKTRRNWCRALAEHSGPTSFECSHIYPRDHV